MIRFSALLCLFTFFVSCKTTHYTPKTYTGSQLVAGSSGGVTGTISEYILFENGQLFRSQGINGEFKEKKKLKKGETGKIFKRSEELGLGTLKFDHPGNMTYYISLRDTKKTHTVKWGETGVAPPPGVKEFYDYLMSALNP
jgi:hypothetical protein